MTPPTSATAASLDQAVPVPVAAPVAQVSPAAGTPNGSLKPSHLPKASRSRKGSRLLFWGGIILGLVVLPLGGLAMVGAFAWGNVWHFFPFMGPQVRTDLVTYKVVRQKELQMKVVERGSLEASSTTDVKCEVKPGLRSNPKIMWVIDNGSLVSGPRPDPVYLGVTTVGTLAAPLGLGPILMTSTLYPALPDLSKDGDHHHTHEVRPHNDRPGDLLVIIDASALEEQAQTYKIARDKAESDYLAAKENYPITKSSITLAIKNLEKWVSGDFPQQQDQLNGNIKSATSDLLQQKDRSAWSNRMVKKGYMTASQAESEKAREESYQLALDQLKEQLQVLEKYTDTTTRKQLQNAIDSAIVAEKTAAADLQAKEQIFEQQDAQYRDLVQQIRNCRIYAPTSGPVVYYIPEQTRFGSGATQSTIAQGEPVQYGQKLITIPEMTRMNVNVRIHEAFINHLHIGLPCEVKVTAASGQVFGGELISVSNIAAPQDWMSPDVKVYQCMVQLKGSLKGKGLRPGLSAEVTILTDTKAENVLAIPSQALLNDRGGKHHVLVLTPQGPEPRAVVLGTKDRKIVMDEKLVMIDEGESEVHEGDNVILNPKTVLNEKDKDKKGAKDDAKDGGPDAPAGGGGDKEHKGGGNRGGAPGGQGGAPGGGGGQPKYQK